MPIFQTDLEQEQQLEQERRHLGFAFESEPTEPDGSGNGDENGNASRKASPEVSSPPIDIQWLRPRPSEESLRTELCEGPVDPDSIVPPSPEQDFRSTSDRAELIERLKRGESPTWAPNRHFEPRDRHQSYHYSPLLPHTPLVSVLCPSQPVPPPTSPRSRSDSPALLPPAQITPEKDTTSEDERRLREGLTIERPRSALHSGDFTQNEHGQARRLEGDDFRSTRGNVQPPHLRPWVATSPPRPQPSFHQGGPQTPASSRIDDFRSVPSSLSSSLSSSFVYKPPTSPLVQSESNDDLDISLPMTGIDLGTHSPSPGPWGRPFHGISPGTPFASPSPRTSTHQRTPSFRREPAFPYQAHQPRRSLTSTPNLSLQNSHTGPPTTPAHLHARRPSLGADTSPLHHASMVGSYEESILRGRMSTNPSKPIEFLAQIGVLGLGKCKPNLRCPPHVTLPFPAVFYSYPTAANAGGPGDDGPSPYVGQIDLENGLPNTEEEVRSKRKAQSRTAGRLHRDDAMEDDAHVEREGKRPSGPQRRRSGSPKAPPGGSYRIPEKGRIQIIIKNQNKTAVKLFLVPYDLSGMEPGTKTFIRQRSYSAGPIVDGLPPAPEGSPGERPVLRYLVHLHMCCPSKGRFYLYRSARIVFANRVPDGTCKLRNETTWPDPRFSPYKPVRVMHPPLTTSSRSAAMLAAEKAFRRRSVGFPYPASFAPYPPLPASQTFHHGAASYTARPVEPIPFRLPAEGRGESGSSESSPRSSVPARGSDGSEGEGKGDNKYEKLSKGDVGYGGNAFFGSSAAGGRASPGEEGLLSRRLRGLGVRPGEED
ncbi:uncharacterized protein DNG_08589 [Cephalotrichum gorgonifer]|uniref:Atos-like conserved domain-containing protein n=1 Tax=Cephalotrichum gorgonifer TaxID=2041049 RepID=A0AAE8N425_9PEZI|nr:uncharacterized protein DNG_08589 [Cephalotrichum gorgonifer]